MLCITVPLFIFEKQVSDCSECLVVWQGCVQYPRALDLQMQICRLKRHGFQKDVLLLLEHPPTITLGRSGKLNNLLVREEDLRSRGISFWNVDRGGDITFHGPGQLVGYPILSLHPSERDVRGYMRNIEESLIRLLDHYGIEAARDARYTGVWTPMGKIAAMGVHISRWITRHGFALNVNTDLSFYDLIVPCGIVNKGVTSIQKHLSREVPLEEVANHYISEFGSLFMRNMVRIREQSLLGELRQYADKVGDVDGCAPREERAV
jgi:lipoate-protein ligase B